MKFACERAAVAKYNVTPVDTKWVDTDKAFERRADANPFTNCCQRVSKVGTGQICMRQLPRLEALKAIISIAANHSPEFSLVHVDVSRAYFHAKAQRPVLVKLPAEHCSGKDKGKIGLLKKSMSRHQKCSKQIGNEIGKGTTKIGVTSWGAVQGTCSTARKGKPRV